MQRRRAARAALVLAAGLGAAPLVAQEAVPVRALSLEQALEMAEGASEQVAMARAGVLRARGEQYRARSERLPQLYGTASYTRTLRSEFQGLGGGGADTTTTAPPAECGRFTPDPSLPLAERVDSLEQALRCQQGLDPFAAFGDLPFGRENSWRFGVSLSQNLFTGGRLAAQGRIARAGREVAEIGLASARAQLVLDVAEAYYDAALAGRLLGIAEATLGQSEATLRQTTLARQVGNAPEFDLLRAQVARDNQRPVVIQRRSEHDLAVLRLKQLLNLPLDDPLELTTPLDDEEAVPVVRLAAQVVRGAGGALADTSAAERAPVRQAARAVEVREGLLRVARAQRLPSLSIGSQYGRVAYPQGGAPEWGDFRSNWTVSASLQLPLFTGGRIRGDELVAEADLTEARARLEQASELARLDTRGALQQLTAAEASWQASRGTVQQASRAYQIAEVRFREGISTQVELADSRILLQQAQANRALAARNLLVARARAALIRDLPLGAGSSSAPLDAGAAPQAAPRPAPQPQPTQDPSQAAFTGGGF